MGTQLQSITARLDALEATETALSRSLHIKGAERGQAVQVSTACIRVSSSSWGLATVIRSHWCQELVSGISSDSAIGWLLITWLPTICVANFQVGQQAFSSSLTCIPVWSRSSAHQSYMALCSQTTLLIFYSLIFSESGISGLDNLCAAVQILLSGQSCLVLWHLSIVSGPQMRTQRSKVLPWCPGNIWWFAGQTFLN